MHSTAPGTFEFDDFHARIQVQHNLTRRGSGQSTNATHAQLVAVRRECRVASCLVTEMAARRPTLHDVARVAGVSLITASRVVGGGPYIAAATRRRVEKAIRELGYRPNQLARTLRTGTTSHTIGLVIEDIANPFYAGIAKAVEEVAREHRCLLITASCEENPNLEREVVGALLQRRVDGLILVPASNGNHRYLRTEARLGTPVVFADRRPVGFRADSVVLDNMGGAKLAVEHLIRQGHRRIAVVGDPPTMPTAEERRAGYQAALEIAGISYDPELVSMVSHDLDQAEQAVRRLLELPEPPTAIFALNNRNCIGTLRAVSGRRVTIVGFDDHELFALPTNQVTVVSYDLGELGRTSVRILFERIDGDHSPTRSIVLPTYLICRGSGEVPPTG